MTNLQKDEILATLAEMRTPTPDEVAERLADIASYGSNLARFSEISDREIMKAAGLSPPALRTAFALVMRFSAAFDMFRPLRVGRYFTERAVRRQVRVLRQKLNARRAPPHGREK